MSEKPFADSSEQNKGPILNVLREVFAASSVVLEIGSGTGQHAVYFAEHLPHLRWHTSELEENHTGIRAWLAEAGLANVAPPLALDVHQRPWPALPAGVDAVFSANTAHIMDWEAVQAMFAEVGRILAGRGVFALYGPFNYYGCHSCESNARFDQWLRQRDPLSGIRDFEALDRLAGAAGLRLLADYEMPVNNRTLVWGATE